MTQDDPRNYVLTTCRDHDVKFVRLWFTDILGSLKSFAITVEELEEALEDGKGFDGGSIEGFARVDESDMVAMPDPATFAILPWRPSERGVARMFCDILQPDGTPFEGDSRHVLKRQLKRASDLGYTFYVSPELEFFYFKSPEAPAITLDRGGYLDLTPLDLASDIRRQTVLTLEEMGIGVEYSHHEAAPSQHEIGLRYTDALTMADSAMTYRIVVKEVALANDVYATFMPKPLAGENGSGMHTHQSLFKGQTNAFFDADDEYNLSPIAKSYVAGLLRHAPDMTLVTNQWVNSYKRLVAGYEAPVYQTWARRNAADLIRVPQYKPGKEASTRIEYRAPDPACNPYLAFAMMLAAGLEGIEREYPLGPPTEDDVVAIGPEERARRGIETLPGSLKEAIEAFRESDFARRALGDHVFDSLLRNKIIEYDDYRRHVTDFETERYLAVL